MVLHIVLATLFLISPTVLTEEEPSESVQVMPAKEEEPPLVEPEWKYEELKRICSCESAFELGGEPQHYELDGVTVRTGRVNPDDRGMCQINAYYHRDTATSLGWDIETPEGNKKYAEWLYEREGNTPWSWSRHCWGA